MRSGARSLAVLVVALLTAPACGPAKSKKSGERVVKIDNLAERMAGTYKISSAKLSDTCGGGIFMATETIEYDPSRGALVASEVGRRYDAELVGDELVARGRFRRRKDCPVYEAVETWRFTESKDGHLSGTLRSLWRLDRRDCLRACKVVFRIDAAPVKAKATAGSN